MKKLICLITSLCIVFSSVFPVYAATINDYQDNFTTPASVTYDQYHIKEDQLGNYQETRADAVSDAITHNLLNDLIRIFTGSGGTMYNSVSEFMSWLVPVGSFNTSHSITEVTLYEIVDYIAWTLSGTGPTVYDTLQSIASMLAYMPSLDSKMSTNNNNLNSLMVALTNYYSRTQSGLTNAFSYANSHYNLFSTSVFGQRGDVTTSRYYLPSVDLGGGLVEADGGQYWTNGTPLGNIAYILMRTMLQNSKIYSYRWDADLTHYNDNLTTWDSQGSTLTQVPFTPDSAIQGLYRYLAFTQRDVARLTYVFANDEELAARELAQANQDQVLDDFIDPNGAGSASPNDFSAISDLSSGYQDNFGSNASVTGIFNIFNSNNMGWFSQETRNQLDTTSPSRSGSETPLLDQQILDIYKAIGVDINESD